MVGNRVRSNFVACSTVSLGPGLQLKQNRNSTSNGGSKNRGLDGENFWNRRSPR